MAKFRFIKRQLGRKYKSGKLIFQQGDEANDLFVIQKGMVEIFLETANGEIPLTSKQKGDIFGEVALFSNKTRFTTARAVVDSRVMTVDERTFVSKLHQDPSFAFRLIKQMATRIYELHHELIRHHNDDASADEWAEQCALTGLPSFPNVDELLETAVIRAKRMLQTMAYAAIDVDDFKLIGEEHGDMGQEKILRSLSETLRDHLRKTDIIGRYGNDRFPVILFEADGQSARRVLENVRTAFSRKEHILDGKRLQATFSCGIAAFPECADAEGLRKAANKSLNQAKSEGRGQVLLAGLEEDADAAPQGSDDGEI